MGSDASGRRKASVMVEEGELEVCASVTVHQGNDRCAKS